MAKNCISEMNEADKISKSNTSSMNNEREIKINGELERTRTLCSLCRNARLQNCMCTEYDCDTSYKSNYFKPVNELSIEKLKEILNEKSDSHYHTETKKVEQIPSETHKFDSESHHRHRSCCRKPCRLQSRVLIADRIPQFMYEAVGDDAGVSVGNPGISESFFKSTYSKFGYFWQATKSSNVSPGNALSDSVVTETPSDLMSILSKSIAGSPMDICEESHVPFGDEKQICTDPPISGKHPSILNSISSVHSTPPLPLSPKKKSSTHSVTSRDYNYSNQLISNGNSSSIHGGNSFSSGLQDSTVTSNATVAHGNVTSLPGFGNNISPVPANIPIMTGHKGSHVLVMVYGNKTDCAKKGCGLRWVPKSLVSESWSTSMPM